jgi:site-specific DNA-methyltransferase (adenine-specific)
MLSGGDAVGWLRQLSDSSVDLVVTDPPYESLEKHRAVGTTTRLKHSKASSNDWFRIFPNSRFEELFVELYRVLRRNRHAYLFCDPETAFVMKPIGESVGFRFWKPLIWDKVTMGMGYHYRARYEMILFFEKGKRKLNDLGVPDVLQARRIHRGYPTEKPVEISDILVRQSTQEGELVIDPFMGSGSVGVAAVGAARSFAGCDIAPEAVEVTRQRLLEAGGVEDMLDTATDAAPGTQLTLTDTRGRKVASRRRPPAGTQIRARRPAVPEVGE